MASAEVCYWRVSCKLYKMKKKSVEIEFEILGRFVFSLNRHEIKPNCFWQSYFEDLHCYYSVSYYLLLFTPDPENLGKRYHLHVHC